MVGTSRRLAGEHGLGSGASHCSLEQRLNTLRPRQNERHFADDIFKCIFLIENIWNSTNISLRFVRKGRINNISALVQIMAWRRPGDKPLSEPMMVSLPTHICVTRPQWVNLQQLIGGLVKIGNDDFLVCLVNKDKCYPYRTTSQPKSRGHQWVSLWLTVWKFPNRHIWSVVATLANNRSQSDWCIIFK